MKFLDLFVGQSASLEKAITEEDVRTFAKLTMDANPIHLDEEYASHSIFGRRIVHGMLISGLISAVLGTRLPGEGTIYLGQELKFLKPVYIDDTITVTVTIKELKSEKKIVKLTTVCQSNKGEKVIDGVAIVKLIE